MHESKVTWTLDDLWTLDCDVDLSKNDFENVN